MLTISCTRCNSKMKLTEDLAGKRVRCPHCQEVQQVPVPAKVVEPTAAQHKNRAVASRAVADVATLPPDPAGTPAAAQGPGSNERYQVAEEIGRGGMGAVARALDNDIRREVAIKYLLHQADEKQKTRFIEEAQITGQLEHPNIVPVHELGVDSGGRLYFAMKMVKGRSLSQLLSALRESDAPTVREFTLARLLNILVNIGHAIAYAHSRDVIHRDLKPANIMLGDFGEVYVMDWGLAKVRAAGEVRGQESEVRGRKSEVRGQKSEGGGNARVATARGADANLTQAGAIIGTPSYMPPEQALGNLEAIDQRSDIYSLGAILYEILTLSPPFGRGGDSLAILVRVAEGGIDPPEKQAPARARQGLIPPELSAVALKALSKDPADRYQTVGALQRDVQLFLEGRSVSAKRDSAWELFKKLVKRN